MDRPYDHLLNRICITPYEETAGLMLVQRVYWSTVVESEWMASGIFVGDHPHGYWDGSPACYQASGLRPTCLVMSTFRNGMFAGSLSKPPKVEKPQKYGASW